MVRLTFAMVVSVAAVNLGTVAAVTASPKERITRADPLLENWEKEEDLANLLSDMIASSKSASPTATNEPSIVRNVNEFFQHYSCPHLSWLTLPFIAYRHNRVQHIVHHFLQLLYPANHHRNIQHSHQLRVHLTPRSPLDSHHHIQQLVLQFRQP